MPRIDIPEAMPAENSNQVKYKRVKHDKDVSFAGTKLYVLIDFTRTFDRLFINHRPNETMSIWAEAIMEQVWLSLVRAGQPVSTMTWVLDYHWSNCDLPIKQQDVRLVVDGDICIEDCLEDYIPVKAPIIVVLVTDDNSETEGALKKFPNICTLHKLLYPHVPPRTMDMSIPEHAIKANNLYCGTPESYFEKRKRIANGKRAAREGGPTHG